MGSSFSDRVQLLSVQLVPFMMAVVFYQYARGWIANRWGDPTAKKEGRLTLNPLPHVDLVGTLIFPIINMLSGINILFGWARPVPIDPRHFKSYKSAMVAVSLAGPGMNFILAFLSAILFYAIQTWIPHTFYLFEPLAAMAGVSVTLNFSLGFFNLIPIPPLDGSKVIEAFLPPRLAQKYQSIAPFGFFILLALLFTQVLNLLRYPILASSELALNLAARLFGSHL